MTIQAIHGARAATFERGSTPSITGPTTNAPPRLGEIGAGYESLGLEALTALLAVESAQEQQKTMKACERDARESQLSALRAQAEAQRARAADTRKEGLVQGAVQIAGGALTIASVAAGPSASAKNNDEWLRADARVVGADARWVSASGRYGDFVQSLERRQKVVETLGSTTTGLARPLAQATFGAAAIEHEADASARGTDAKFWENAASDYADLAHAAAASADKLRQLLGAVSQERTMLARTLARIG
ncbi:MAG: hypothetical protein JNL79_01125 [Myxococcales bacterium]|nr:hypothetical protein [Myxococcales bacterium]